MVSQIPAGTCGIASNVAELSGDTYWFAVWFDDQSGWSPVEAFEPPPSEPPWPDSTLFEDVTPADGSAPPPAPESGSPSCDSYAFNDQYPIRLCDEGPAVRFIQSALNSQGFPVDVDGYFGPTTAQAVREFQQLIGLDVDGLVGPDTWLALETLAPGADLDGNGVVDPDEVVIPDEQL